MRRRALVTGAVMVAVACTAGAAASAGEQALPPLLGSDTGGRVFSVPASGGELTRLFPCAMGYPTRTPDGRQYLATSLYPGTSGTIFRLPADVPITGFCQIAHRQKLVGLATGMEGCCVRFSPNGRKLLYVNTARVGTPGQLLTAAPNGSGKRVLRSKGVLSAGWSPDGRKLVLARAAFFKDCPTRQGKGPESNPYCYTGEIQITDANAGNARTIYVVPKEKPLRQFVRITDVDWSKNGKILFTVRAGGEATQLATINPDGSGLRALTPWPRGAYGGVWSPDGKWIAFTQRGTTSAPGGTYVMTASGKKARKVTDTRARWGLDW